MDTTRLILIMALVLLGFQLYQAWQLDYGKPVEKPAAPVPASATDIPDLATAREIPSPPPGGPAPTPDAAHADAGEPASSRILVETDVFRIEIDARTGNIHRAGLKHYPIAMDQPDIPLELMDDSPELTYYAQGGLLSKQPAPAYQDKYRIAAGRYELGENQERLRVPLVWESGPVRVTKTYTFERGSYLVGVEYLIENGGAADWTGRSYSQLKRDDPGRGSRFGIYTYTGAVLSSPENRYEKIPFKDISEKKLEQDITGGWAAMIQHYFVTALIPVDTAVSHHYYTTALGDGNFAIGIITPQVTVPAGGTATIAESMYIGPKIQKTMREIAEGLDLTVDYGWLWFLSKPLFRVLQWLHGLTGNWGWAIILVTIFLKLLFFPLSAAGYKSMARMRRIQPRIMALRDRYQNDKARLNKAMMDIYKEEKINPFGGCLPILVQIPVFIALYWVLLESVEMRQAPFIFWIRDLSVMDPFYILPLLMGVSMFIQQKLNPAPPDPVQAKVMQILPVVFTVFFAFFPAGLVLYWVFSNILSIAQQWQITRSLERAGLAPASK